MGKLIVIDGLDGCGKQTQADLLFSALKAKTNVKKVEFPTYTKSSALIEMYLSGEFGESAELVGPYAASTFFAVDRVSSYIRDWKGFYDGGGLVLADRYTTSNAIHQLSKLPRAEWDGFLDWLYDFEFVKLQLPKPSLVIYLSMPVSISEQLLLSRYGGDESKKDLHERDLEYQNRCREAAQYCAQRLSWQVIDCAKDGKLSEIEDIAAEVQKAAEKVL